MASPNLYKHEELFNVIVLNGHSSPGVVKLSGHETKVVWDVQGGPFQNGSIIRYKWSPPVEFQADFYLVDDPSQGLDDTAKWDDFARLIEATVNNPRQPKAVPIYHPDLARNKIKSVVKASIGGMSYDGKGGTNVTVKFQQYLAPRKWEGTPQVKPENDPNAALKKQLDALTNQFKATPWG